MKLPGASTAILVNGAVVWVYDDGSLQTETAMIHGYGMVTVDGANASWINLGRVVVFGYSPETQLIVDNGAQVELGSIHVGGGDTSLDVSWSEDIVYGQGAVVVRGPGSALKIVGDTAPGSGNIKGGGPLKIGMSPGRQTVSTLTISSGGSVHSGTGEIGVGSPGEAVVSGENSQWNICVLTWLCASGGLRVGDGASGSLVIEKGAELVHLSGVIGVEATGIATVTGQSSRLWSQESLTVGKGGDGLLTIADGAVVRAGMNSQLDVVIAEEAGSTGTIAFGAAPGAVAVAPGALQAGAITFGAGDGAVVFNHTGTGHVFSQDISGSGRILVEAGTTALTGSNSYSGETRITGGRLNASGGAAIGDPSMVVVFASATVGIQDSETIGGLYGGGTVRLGAGTTLTFGRDGGPNTTFSGFFVEDGPGASIVKTGTGTVLMTRNHSSTGGTTIGSGAINLVGGSINHLGAATVIGNRPGYDAALTIANGGAVSNLRGIVGQTAGAIGTVVVSGTNARWANATDLLVGGLGEGSLAVRNGGRVDVGNGAGIASFGTSSSSKGRLVIGAMPGGAPAGPGDLNAGEVRFGDGEGSLDFNHTGQDYRFTPLISGTAALVHHAGVTTLTGDNTYSGPTTIRGGTLAVEGASDQGTSSYVVGQHDGDKGTLAVRNGGNLTSGTSFVARAQDSRGDAIVTGPGSRWNIAGELIVGELGDGAMSIGNGGVVTDTSGIVGFRSGSRGAVTVSGAGSRWANTDELYLGIEGEALLEISDGGLVQVDDGAGVLHLGVDAGSTGELIIGAPSVLAAVGPGALEIAELRFGNGDATLDINHTGLDYTFAADISGAGTINHHAGVTNLTGDGSGFTGETSVGGGSLNVHDTLGGSVDVFDSGRLGGTGVIGGDVTLASGGTIGPGMSPGTLTIGGDLLLSGGSILDYELGPAGMIGSVNDLIVVGGDLTLDGTLNITDLGGFGPGIYRLIDYGGLLTDNGLAIGAVPTGVGAGDLFVQTSVAAQVNLISTAGAELGFWDGGIAALHDDGAIDGGSGAWRADGRNWTSAGGAVNGSFPSPGFAIFQGTAGTVTIDDGAGAIAATGMQFTTDGYMLTGDALELAGPGGASIVRVGDGTAAGAGITATIDAELTGAGNLVKADLGTLILSGANSYAGGTIIRGGVLEASSDGDLGATMGGLTLDGGSFRYGDGFDSDRSIVLASDNGRFDTNGFDATLAGSIAGAGNLKKSGTGTLTLAGASSYAGNTLVEAGTLIGGASSIRGSIGNAGTMVFDQGTDGSFAGAIAGLNGTDGQMIKRGAGALALISTSTLDWTVEAGGLVSAADRFGGNLDLGAGTRFTFEQDSAGSYGGTITGTGDLRVAGTGTANLTGNSSGFAGLTGVEGGTLLVSGQLGGSVDVLDTGRLGGTGMIGGDVTLASGGAIAPGISPGTLTIGGDLTLSEGSTLNYELGPAGMIGGVNDLISVGGDLTLDGTLNITDLGGFGVGLNRLIDYGGSLTDNGFDVGSTPAGVLPSDLTVDTATVGEINLLVATTPLTFWDGANTTDNGTIDGGTGTWNVTTTNWTSSAGALNRVFDPASLLIFSGTAGTVSVNNGAGVVSTSGMQFAVDGYTVAGDDLTLSGSAVARVGDGTGAGSGFSTTISSNLIGTGSLEKTDLGALILTGTNAYTGGTTISAGSLVGDARSLQGDIVNNAALTFDQASGGTFADVISGTGSLTKNGADVLTLSADSSGFAGATALNAGSLIVNGQLGGSLAVNGGTLGGSGTVGDLTANSGSMLAPGNSIGTLNVASATFNTGSTYTVELDDGGFVAGTNNDRLNATGTVTINGGTVHVTQENGTDDGSTYAPGTYTIIAASSVTGTFDSSTPTDDYVFLGFALDYSTANQVDLISSQTVTFSDIAATPNQQAIADPLEALGSGNAIYDALVGIVGDEDDARAAFDSLTGEIHASAKTALLEDSRFPREAALDRLRIALGGAGANAGQATQEIPEGTTLWAQGFGSWSQWDSDGNAATLGRNIGGLFMGADAEITNDVTLGLMGGYSRSSLSVADRMFSGTVDSYTLGAYAGGSWDSFSLKVGLAHSWHSLNTSRSVAFTGFSDSLFANYNARTFQAYTEAAYNIDIGNARFEPFANLAQVNLTTDGFTETGGVAALTAPASSANASITTLGLRAEADVALGETNATLSGGLGWRHAFGGVPTATHSVAAGGNAFTVSRIPLAKDALVLDAGFNVDLSNNATLGFAYNGQFGSGISDHSAKASFNVKF